MTSRRFLAVLAVVVGIATPAVANAADSPENHTLPDCPASQAHVWMDYRADTYTDDGGHTYGPATTLTCDPNPPQGLHIRYLPSVWTWPQSTYYCAQSGAVYYSLWGNTANVCAYVDY